MYLLTCLYWLTQQFPLFQTTKEYLYFKEKKKGGGHTQKPQNPNKNLHKLNKQKYKCCQTNLQVTG